MGLFNRIKYAVGHIILQSACKQARLRNFRIKHPGTYFLPSEIAHSQQTQVTADNYIGCPLPWAPQTWRLQQTAGGNRTLQGSTVPAFSSYKKEFTHANFVKLNRL